MKQLIVCISLILLMPYSVYAADKKLTDKFEWEIVPGLTSANLAHTPWHLISSNALGWPDGRSGLITYWQGGEAKTLYIRCIDYMNSSFQNTGASCAQPVSK